MVSFQSVFYKKVIIYYNVRSEKIKMINGDNKMNQCPNFKKCGGCQYLDLPYEEQLKKELIPFFL